MTSEVERERLAAILARLEAATGADREIDADIALGLGLPQAYFAQFSTDIGGYAWKGWSDVDGPKYFASRDQWGGGGRAWVVPAYTASIDAAVALADQVLPLSHGDYDSGDYTYTIGRRFDGKHRVMLLRSGGEMRWSEQPEIVGATLPLAMCEAVVRARLNATPSPD